MECPECGKQVSDLAVACPNCGFSFDTPNTIADSSNTGALVARSGIKEKTSSVVEKHRLLFGISLIILTIIFIIVIDYPVTNLIIFSVQHLTSALFKDIISGIIIPPW